MIMINIDYTSQALKRKSEFIVLLPEQQRVDNILLLLHGRGDDKTAWIHYTNITRYNQSSLIIIPSGDASFYLNQVDGAQYQDYLEELINFVESRFNLTNIKLNIAGNSMGGFGSLALVQKSCIQFDTIGLFSPAIKLSTEYLEGYPNTLLHSELKSVIKGELKIKQMANNIFLYCGKNDKFYNDCLEFSNQYEVELLSDEYGHEWDAWDKWIKIYMERL